MQSITALERLLKSADLHPDDADLNFDAGWQATQARQATDALRCLIRVVERKPDHARAWHLLGAVYREIGDLMKARYAFENALHLGYEDYRVYWGLGTVLVAQGDSKAAISEYQRALLLCAVPETRAKIHLSLADCYAIVGNSCDQKRQYEKALQDDPNCADACYGLAYFLASAGNYSAALPYLERAVAVDPTDPDLWGALGHTALQLRHYQRAKEAFKRTLGLGKRNTEILDCLVEVLFELDDFEGARERAKEVLSLDPNDAIANYYLGRIALSLDDDIMAVFYLEQAARQKSEPKFHLALGKAYLKQGRWIDAEVILRPLLGTDQHDGALVLLIKMFCESGQVAEALNMARSEVLLRPATTVAWVAQAMAQAANADYSEAVVSFGKAVELDPNDFWVKWASEEAGLSIADEHPPTSS